MKLLTLNTHSLLEENYQEKLQQFIEVIIKEKPDIIAMQEVNQTRSANIARQELLIDFTACTNDTIMIREDNYALQVALLLRRSNIACSWTWISAKIGYEIYDEGLAIFCINNKITNVDSFFLSQCKDYNNWKTRKILGIQINNCKDWFYTVHMGWWNDKEEPFKTQWEKLDYALQKKKQDSIIWLLGDFNSPAEIRDQGYDYITSLGWFDTYKLAKEKDSGITVEGIIDGWDSCEQLEGMRIDYIFCSQSIAIQNSNVLFNGKKEPKISDHFGVLIET